MSTPIPFNSGFFPTPEDRALMLDALDGHIQRNGFKMSTNQFIAAMQLIDLLIALGENDEAIRNEERELTGLEHFSVGWEESQDEVCDD